MTVSTDFDRFLAATLEADGPQSIDSRVVDAALATAAAIPQRRPLVPVLDRRAWPSRLGARTRGGTDRRLLVGAAVLLLLALLAATIVSLGSPTSLPVPLAAGERVVLSGGNDVQSVVEFIDAGGSIRYGVEGRGRGCLHVLAGTTIAATVGFGEWVFVDVTDGSPQFSVPTNYTGFEAWSASGDRLALVDYAGSIGMVDLASGTPAIRSVTAPGVAAVDWSYDGSRLAAARVEGAQVVIDVVDRATGDTREAARFVVDGVSANAASGESWIQLDWGSRGDTVVLAVAPDGTEPASFVRMVDLAAGTSSVASISVPLYGGGSWTVQGDAYAWSTPESGLSVVGVDGSPIFSTTPNLGPLGFGSVLWSPTGDALASIEVGFDRSLRVVGRDGQDRGPAVDSVMAYSWSTDGTALVVARPTLSGVEIAGISAADMSMVGVIGHAGYLDMDSGPCLDIHPATESLP